MCGGTGRAGRPAEILRLAHRARRGGSRTARSARCGAGGGAAPALTGRPGAPALRLFAGSPKRRLPEEEVRRLLAQRLPAYMLPGRLFWLDELPVTENGKCDRAQLAREFLL